MGLWVIFFYSWASDFIEFCYKNLNEPSFWWKKMGENELNFTVDYSFLCVLMLFD